MVANSWSSSRSSTLLLPLRVEIIGWVEFGVVGETRLSVGISYRLFGICPRFRLRRIALTGDGSDRLSHDVNAAGTVVRTEVWPIFTTFGASLTIFVVPSRANWLSKIRLRMGTDGQDLPSGTSALCPIPATQVLRSEASNIAAVGPLPSLAPEI